MSFVFFSQVMTVVMVIRPLPAVSQTLMKNELLLFPVRILVFCFCFVFLNSQLKRLDTLQMSRDAPRRSHEEKMF